MLLLYGLFLTMEAVRAARDRAGLKHVIYVNGTRGKSTVTRMIDAGLRGAGYRVLSKTTGTLPLCIHADGREEEIFRRAPANIREQLAFLHLAAKEGAEILVIECMALDPKLQEISSRRMLRADIGVITNVRLDHTDVMGETREEILSSLMRMLPEKGQVFTAERELFPQLRAEADRLKSRLELALPEDAADWEALDFPDNTALALKVCQAVSGAPAGEIMEAMRNFRRDPYALKTYRRGALRLINALSANDVTSIRIILEQERGGQEEKLILLINNRADRPARARDMARLCGTVMPEEIWLLGEGQNALAALCRRRAPQARIRRFSSADEIPLTGDIQPPALILAVGNIKGEGIRLSERVNREMTETERQ